jgi:hypothetical protein
MRGKTEERKHMERNDGSRCSIMKHCNREAMKLVGL